MAEAHGAVSPARVFARPTADQVWLGPAQEAGLSQLSRAARVRLLLGPPSSGKTTLLSHLVARLPHNDIALACRGRKDDAAAVLRTLLLSADLAPWDLSEIEQRNLFTVFLQQRCSQHRRVFVVLDDAHQLKPAAWVEIERLLALKVERKPAVDLLVAGPPTLRQDIARLETIRAADVVSYALDEPSQENLTAYVEWRLTRFAMTDVFTPIAMQMIAQLSAGRYSATDVLCQMSLLLMRRLRLPRVDARVARQAVAALAARQNANLETQTTADAAAPGAPPQGYLLVSRAGKPIDRVPLGQRTLLGRSEHNDVCLPSPYLSRHHAAIVGTPEGYYVVDLNSVNGLTLNGCAVQRAVLCDQDVLAIGPFRMKVQIPEHLAQGDPLPQIDSLTDTALLPPPGEPGTPSAIRRVK
jgi:general secretion pathway protein A